MSLGAIIVCRLDSKRLPGKVLKKIRGKPLLWYVISRAKKIKSIDKNIIIATTERKVDEPIVEYSHKERIKVFRGSAENVAKRVLSCAINNNLDYFLRVNADSPFLEPSIANLAFEIAQNSEYEIITNLYPRSFPYGVSVELFSLKTFVESYKKMSSKDHFQHVSLYFYQNMHLFHYYNILQKGMNHSDLRLTIDTPEDFKKFDEVLGMMDTKWEMIHYKDVIDFYKIRENKKYDYSFLYSAQRI